MINMISPSEGFNEDTREKKGRQNSLNKDYLGQKNKSFITMAVKKKNVDLDLETKEELEQI